MVSNPIFNTIKLLLEELEKLPPISAENKEKLNKKFRLEFHYNTNHIEGNTLTYAETELLLIFDETRGSHSLREHEEMKGSNVALELVKELAEEIERPLTETFIKNLNKILLVRPYWKDAITLDGQETKRKIIVGDYKEFPNSVLLENGEVFNYSSPSETPRLMGELLEWFNEELSKGRLHPIELAAVFHHKFVLIHPFDDGNGRMSRLLINYVLYTFDYPPLIVKSEDKVNYLRALRDADTGNMDSFVTYLGNQLIWSFNLLIKAAKNESIDEIDDWRKNLKLLKRELDGTEGIKEKRSNAVIKELINTQILPLSQIIDKELAEFAELFLSNSIYYRAKNEGKFRLISSRIEDEVETKLFRDEIEFFLRFNEFRKKIDDPFDVNLYFQFSFDDYSYSAFVDNTIIFSNLYHQEITASQMKQLTSHVANLILVVIENKL